MSKKKQTPQPRSRMLSGSPFLIGDNSTPGVKIHPEVKAQLDTIFTKCKEFGLDFYPTIIEFCTYDDISEIASYGGFPVRYPHWSFGMEYEEMSRGYEYGMHRISEMVVNCLALDTSVLTQRGTIKASEVKKTDILYANGPRQVAKVVRQPIGDRLGIKIKGRLNPTVCSPNHKWRVLREEGFEWVETSNLVTGDLIVGCDTYNQWKGVPAAIQLKDISTPTHMTLELAELMGVITGDGSQGVASCENTVTVVIGKEFPAYKDHVAGLFRAVFGSEPLIEDKGTVWSVTFCSKAAVDFLDATGLKKGVNCSWKVVPYSIQQSSSEYRAAFLRGYFDTDGFASDILGATNKSDILLSGVQLLLSEMGIYSHVTRVNNEHNDEYVLKVQGHISLCKFRERVGFVFDHKMYGLMNLINVQNCVSGGQKVPYLQKMLLELAEELDFGGSKTPLHRSRWNMQKEQVGINTIVGFMFRAISEGYLQFSDLYNHLSVPFYQVEKIDKCYREETIDIALWNDEHDFIADGLMSHNTNPCVIYCLDSNTLVDNVDVIAHALGHNDFFKNNVFFRGTNTDMMNKFANHGKRIRKYMARWGKERVTEFIDHVLRVDTLIDASKEWRPKPMPKLELRDRREIEHPERHKPTNEYMEDWVNTNGFIGKQKEKLERKEIAKELEIFSGPEKDIFGFLKDNAPLRPWQQDIVSMLYEESIYFAPQRLTKMINEGWASYVDFHLMCGEGLCAAGQERHDMGIIQYAKHKTLVLGGEWSQNPYKLGFELLMDIEERWNKGRFGREYDECDEMVERKNWNKKLGLGREKVFQVRECCNDLTLIAEYFTPEFCEKMQYYERQKFPSKNPKYQWEWRITNKDFKFIKKKLMQRYVNGGLPDIRLVDPNHRGKGWFLMQHMSDGRQLYDKYARETMTSIYRLWKNNVALATVNEDDEEVVYLCVGKDPAKDVTLMHREDYESI